MPITSGAKKALRASKRKRVFNVRRKKDMDGTLTSFRKLIAAKDKAGATKLLSDLYQTLDKSAKTGFIKTNAAARLKSRAAVAIKKLG